MEMEDLDSILGNGEEIEGVNFPDKRARMIYPIPLESFSKFMKNLLVINLDLMWRNFLDDEVSASLTEIITVSLSDEKEAMKIINAKNYKYIMKRITDINGIDLSPPDDNTNGEPKKKD